MVGTWWSGQEHRVRLGIDDLLLMVVTGDGTLVVPVDFGVRRPDPVGSGRSFRDKLTQLDRPWRESLHLSGGAACLAHGHERDLRIGHNDPRGPQW